MSGKGFKGRPNQATLDNIALPTKIKCRDCNKNLMAARYSNKQLRTYQESIYKKGEFNAERPKCQPCMGTQVDGESMYCNGCNLSKSREDFSKNARRNRDNAVCVSCQQRILDQEPNVEDAIKEAEIEEDYHRKGSSAFSLGGIGTSLPSASKKSSNNAPSEAGTDDSGKVWITEPLSTGGRLTAPRGRTQPNMSHENSRRRSGSQESATTMRSGTTSRTVTSDGKWDGYEGGNGSRMAESNASQDRWHKQGAPKKTAVEKAMAAVQRSIEVTKHEQLLKDSDSDGSDYEM